MSLTDILDGVVLITGATIGIYCFKKLMKEHYIPWTNELEKEYYKEEKEMNDDYRFSDEDKK